VIETLQKPKLKNKIKKIKFYSFNKSIAGRPYILFSSMNKGNYDFNPEKRTHYNVSDYGEFSGQYFKITVVFPLK
jgi:hypothetical protein